jgi:hypothetical protein
MRLPLLLLLGTLWGLCAAIVTGTGRTCPHLVATGIAGALIGGLVLPQAIALPWPMLAVPCAAAAVFGFAWVRRRMASDAANQS